MLHVHRRRPRGGLGARTFSGKCYGELSPPLKYRIYCFSASCPYCSLTYLFSTDVIFIHLWVKEKQDRPNSVRVLSWLLHLFQLRKPKCSVFFDFQVWAPLGKLKVSGNEKLLPCWTIIRIKKTGAEHIVFMQAYQKPMEQHNYGRKVQNKLKMPREINLVWHDAVYLSFISVLHVYTIMDKPLRILGSPAPHIVDSPWFENGELLNDTRCKARKQLTTIYV